MNPSKSGWIPKYMNLWEDAFSNHAFDSKEVTYTTLQKLGFVYGVSTASILQPIPTKIILTTDELTKINLFHLLVTTYSNSHTTKDNKETISSILSFYSTIEKGKKNFFNQFTRYSKNHTKLERVLAVRIHESNHLLKRSFTSLLTHAFLYIDVIAYQRFLFGAATSKEFIEHFETLAMHACFLALQSKQKKNKYDRLLLELFEASEALNNYIHNEEDYTKALEALTPNERNYILDMSVLAVWDDHTMDASEAQFLRDLSARLSLSEKALATSIEAVVRLTQNNEVHLKLFEYSHPVNQFYKQSTKTVKTLIVRNKKRLLIELQESGELIVLLGKSTSKDLSADEKAKVKAQLLDICKTIPSLTIFLLPGGTLLLPLLIKFIPQLLPSAFDENRIEK